MNGWLLARYGGRAVMLVAEHAAGLARQFGAGGEAAGVDAMADGALIGAQKLFDLLQAFGEPGGLGGAGRLDRRKAEHTLPPP